MPGPRRSRPQPGNDLPLHRDPTARFLPAMVALLVFLVTLTLLTSFYVTQLANTWSRDLQGRVTVQVPGSDPASSPEAATLDQVLAMLERQPGVSRARQLPPGEQQALLEPWLGDTAAMADLPLPALIDVQLDRPARFDPAATQTALREIAPGAVVDDHSQWLTDLRRLAQAIAVLAATLVALIALGAITLIIFAIRMGLAIHAKEIDLLHTIGATDRYIARQFQRHAARLGWYGGLTGELLAIAAATGLIGVVHDIDTSLLGDVNIHGKHVAAVAAVPVASAAISWLTARWTVLRELAKRP